MPTNSEDSKYLTASSTVVVYNFHNIFSQERLFIFSPNLSTTKSLNSDLKSISGLFANANWLERETSEMSGIVFAGKQDLRNLMLSYGDSSAPLRKSAPSTGFREIFFDINNDTLIQTPITLQI